jgi:hypothetical protein
LFLNSKWTIYVTVLFPIILKMLERFFGLAIGIDSYSFYRTFDGTSFEKKLIFYHFLKSRCMQNKKVLQTFSIWWEITLSCTLFILSLGTTIRTDQDRFNHTVFIELFTAHLLEKNSRFYHSPKPRYIPNKKCYNIMNTL